MLNRESLLSTALGMVYNIVVCKYDHIPTAKISLKTVKRLNRNYAINQRRTRRVNYVVVRFAVAGQTPPLGTAMAPNLVI